MATNVDTKRQSHKISKITKQFTKSFFFFLKVKDKNNLG
jgi:hypothetical protein